MRAVTLDDIKETVQISNVFIMPLLNLPSHVQPIETYLAIKGLEMNDGYNLVMLFHNESPDYPEQLKAMKANKHYDISITDNEFDIVIFEMSDLDVEYDHIINGCYSTLPQSAKILINYHRASNIKALVAIHPEYYYEQYANLLNINVDSIKGHQLMPPPNAEQETLTVSKNTLFLLKQEYMIMD